MKPKNIVNKYGVVERVESRGKEAKARIKHFKKAKSSAYDTASDLKIFIITFYDVNLALMALDREHLQFQKGAQAPCARSNERNASS